MALGLDVGKVSMTGIYDVTNSKMVNHQAHDYLTFEEIYSTAQILRKSSSKGIAKIELCIWYTYTPIQYWLNLNLVSELQYLELPEKSNSKSVKFDTWNNSTIATVF